MKELDILKEKFNLVGEHHKIKLLRGNKFFEAWLNKDNDGIKVTNLAKKELLEWKVFTDTIDLLKKHGGEANRGNAHKYKLGGEGLSIETIEGYIAKENFDKKEGDSVFRRITPICCILIWAGICYHKKNKLALISE